MPFFLNFYTEHDAVSPRLGLSRDERVFCVVSEEIEKLLARARAFLCNQHRRRFVVLAFLFFVKVRATTEKRILMPNDLSNAPKYAMQMNINSRKRSIKLVSFTSQCVQVPKSNM